MNTFEESDLELTFPSDWIVRQFDRTPAYQSVSGHGLKGVDFLCLLPQGDVWLVEVKNYRSRTKEHRAVRRNPEALAAHVGKKFSDTKRLVRIVNRAMRRHWWSGLLLLWYDRVKRERPGSHYWFWAEARRRIDNPRKLVCLLWIETPERAPDYESATREALDEWLEPGNVLKLAEMDAPGDVPLSVKLLSQN